MAKTRSRCALILGANGQDGSFLVDVLASRDYQVTGVGRQPLYRWPAPKGNFRYQLVDVCDAVSLRSLLDTVKPDFIFHMAVTHGGASFDYEAAWHNLYRVNVLSVIPVLRYMQENRRCRLIYASSVRAFGALPARVTENTVRRPHCLYGTSKNAAQDIIDYYGRQYGTKSSVLYLFNHESERRPVLEKPFFSRMVVDVLARALRDKNAWGEFQTLNFHCDWGSAREYMEAAVDIAEQGIGQHYIVATGRTWHARKMMEMLFARHGRDWRKHVRERNPRGDAGVPYKASTARLRQAIGYAPCRSILDVLDEMLYRLHPDLKPD